MHGLGGILEHEDVASGDDLPDGLHVGRATEQVDGHHGGGA